MVAAVGNGFPPVVAYRRRLPSPIVFDNLDLEREIDSFASQVATLAFSGGSPMPVTKGYHAGLNEQLALIETKAAALRDKAVEAFR
jgi:hypothetical protein